MKMKFVGWQLARYASPVTDILQFFFCSTSKAFRDAHFDELLHFYHHSLAALISRLIDRF